MCNQRHNYFGTKPVGKHYHLELDEHDWMDSVAALYDWCVKSSMKPKLGLIGPKRDDGPF